jgi:methylenetetrahydrofolate reductase (NADPH)
MHIAKIFEAERPAISFEFFPTKTEAGAESLFETIRRLEPLEPAYVSVTYGAGGSTRDLTHDLVVRIGQTTSLTTVPHLTCVCHSQADIDSILTRYRAAKVDNILALGGDPPHSVGPYDRSRDAFQHAADLVRFIRSFNGGGGPQGFGVGVAGFPEGHPATPNRLLEMDHLKAKVDAGADYICTQLFFDNRDFLDFRERCELSGIRIPIVAGIMPITALGGMRRMAELAAGARYPAALLRQIQAHENDPKAVAQIGIDWATEQCRGLLRDETRGIHFYTLNKSDATLEIYRNLDLHPRSA